jgi:hypothetical protein
MLTWWNGRKFPLRNLLVDPLMGSRLVEILDVETQDTMELLLTEDQYVISLKSAFDLCFQKKRKSSRCHPAQGFRLHNEERLLPGPHHPRQKHQEEPIRLPTGWSFDLPTQNDERHA